MSRRLLDDERQQRRGKQGITHRPDPSAPAPWAPAATLADPEIRLAWAALDRRRDRRGPRQGVYMTLASSSTTANAPAACQASSVRLRTARMPAQSTTAAASRIFA